MTVGPDGVGPGPGPLPLSANGKCLFNSACANRCCRKCFIKILAPTIAVAIPITLAKAIGTLFPDRLIGADSVDDEGAAMGWGKLVPPPVAEPDAGVRERLTGPDVLGG